MNIVDFHTHDLHVRHALISVEPGDFVPQAERCYSVGIHPWRAGEAAQATLEALLEAARHPQVLAVGETGLDSLRGPSLEVQERLMRHHIAVAREVGKPLVIHCVRTSSQVLRLRRECPGEVPWVIHGFRGNEHVAGELLRHGLYLSYGARHNAAALRATPPERLLIETDDSGLPIATVAATVAATLGWPAAQVLTVASRNACRLLFPHPQPAVP